ncbi:MAG: type II restriction endonuclease [Rikenellaceae bacterium]
MKENFILFLSQLCKTNSTLGSLTDFEKVTANVSKISLKLCQLNHLLGRDDLEMAIKEIFDENPKAFSVLNILVAVRKGKHILNNKGNVVYIDNYFSTYESICDFVKETGLYDIFKSKRVTNLVDYVFGVEVGLDTNARKNRGGTIMERCVSHSLKEAGIKFDTQVSSSKFPDIISLGEDLKRFDFVVYSTNKTFLIETNFYNSGGSKLNETARAYTDIAPKINKYPQYEFVWITDGEGWLSAKNKLEEAFNTIPRVYNLTTLKDFINELK